MREFAICVVNPVISDEEKMMFVYGKDLEKTIEYAKEHYNRFPVVRVRDQESGECMFEIYNRK